MLTHPVGAAFQLPVHLTGETGTGKDLVARAIHQLSSLHNGTYVPLNLGAFPAELVASALFGHIKGAFTGALEDRKGAIRTAQNGVLFLDEIGETPLNAQVMLLRFLDRFEFQPIGSDATHEARLQLVTASNVDLQKLVQEGRFRADLLHRLCGLVLSLPPLRERRDDIPLLVRAFMKARGLSTDLSDEVMDFLKTREWPGNIRQLKACIDRFALVGSQSDLKEAVRMLEINEFNQQDHGDDLPLEDLRRDYDRRILTDRLRRFAGDTVATAESLGISRRSVYDLARRLEVDIQGSDKD
jgi:DNA-binding NtrC family response regulator